MKIKRLERYIYSSPVSALGDTVVYPGPEEMMNKINEIVDRLNQIDSLENETHC